MLTLGAVELVFRVLGYRPVYDEYSSPDEFFRHDPDLGWSFAPGSDGEYVGPRPFPVEYRTDVRINSLGLRGPEVAPVPPGGLRVLVLGDSWTAGLEVPEDRTYSSLLAEGLSDRLGLPVQVLNAGVRGYGTDQALLSYRERLRTLDPDVVLFHTTGNDPDDNTVVHRMRRVFSKPAFVLGSDGDLRLVGQPVHRYPQCSEYRVVDGEIHRVDGRRARTFCSLQTRLSDHSAFFSFVTERLQGNPDLVRRLYGLGSPSDASPPDDQGTPSTAASATVPSNGPTSAPTAGEAAPRPPAGGAPGLDYAHRLTSALILALGEDVQTDGARFVLIGRDADLAALDVTAFDRAGIETVGIEGALTDPSRVLIPNDGHPNELGHERIAELLAGELEPRLQELVR